MEFHHVCRTDPKRPRLADCTAGKEFTQHTVRHLALKKTSYYVVLQRNIYRNHAKGNIGLNFFDEVVRKKRKNLIYLWKFQFICCADDSSDQTKIQKNPAIKDWIAGHNIVRIALYCKRINSHFFIFSSSVARSAMDNRSYGA